MGALDFKLKKVHLYAQRPVNITYLCSADPTLALVPASRYDCQIQELYLNVCAKFHFIERGLDGAQYFILNKMPLFDRKSVNTNVSLSAAQILALVPASRHNCYAN